MFYDVMLWELTCPGPLAPEGEAGALGVGVADGGRLPGAVHGENAALLVVGGPTTVVHVPRAAHASHACVLWRERDREREREEIE